MPTEPEADLLLQGSCHCGAVKLRLPHQPLKATRCNCSICRRLGAVYAYFDLGTVAIEAHPEHTQAYICGDKTLRTLRCRTGGCTTHWEPLGDDANGQHGVNLNLFDPALLERVNVRRFDGAVSWTFVD